MVASAVFAAGCSLTVDPDQVQCRVAADCAEIGFPDFDCINDVCAGSIALNCANVDWPPIGSGQVQVSIRTENIGMNMLPNVPVYACAPFTPGDCTQDPIAGPVYTTQADATAKFSVTEGFRGHFFVPGDDAAGRSPYLLNMHPPPDPDHPETLSATLRITDIATLTGIAKMLTGVQIIADRSLLFFSVRDCQGNLLEGVTVEVGQGLDEVKPVFIGTNGTADTNLTKTGTAGRGVLINIPAGLLPVSAFLNGEKIFQQSLSFETNTITSTSIVPSKY
jgi:hypothetical protein